MSDTFSKVEVITGVARRRRFTTEQKLAVVSETMQPGLSISYVARRHGLSPSLVFRWRRPMSKGGKEASSTVCWAVQQFFGTRRDIFGEA
jgi:transposase